MLNNVVFNTPKYVNLGTIKLVIAPWVKNMDKQYLEILCHFIFCRYIDITPLFCKKRKIRIEKQMHEIILS